MARINRALNFVVPVFGEADRDVVYVHQAPVLAETFERYYRVLAQTYGAMMTQGAAMMVAAPRVAAIMLKEAAENMDAWEGPEGVQNGLVREIRRLSNVVALDPAKGWQPIPLEKALKDGLISPEDWTEVEGIVTFFIVVSAMQQRRLLKEHLEMSANAWSAQVTSSTPMEFAASLPTSTPAGSSGEIETT